MRSATKRMPREARRAQLLETASAIIRSQGTDALTLAAVAEQAGVTKPIAYEHFKTRAGLLIALYRDYDERQIQALRAALSDRPHTLEDIVAMLSTAYVDCVVAAGPEVGAIAAALAATEEMDSFRQSLRDGYADLYSELLSGLSDLPKAPDRLLIVGIIAAADALSQAAAHGKTRRTEAIGALSRIMLATLASARA